MQQGIKELQWFEYLKVVAISQNIKYAIMLVFANHITFDVRMKR